MAEKSIKKRIDDLVNELSGSSLPPNPAEFRGKLVQVGLLVEALEDGAAIREAEAKLEAAHTALEQANTQNAKIESELQAAHSEIEKFRAEQNKREEKERDIPDIQFQILELLPSEHGGIALRIDEIASAVNLPVDVTEIHVKHLDKFGWATHWYNEPEGVLWRRTDAGNELVYARQLATEEEPAKQKAREHVELAQMETTVLFTVARHGGMTAPEIVEQVNKSIPTKGNPIANFGVVMLFLVKLSGKNLVTDREGRWFASRDGIQCLKERGLF